MFNFSRKVLTETKIYPLEKALRFASTPTMINESELKRDVNEFSSKMRCKLYFRNEPRKKFSEKSSLNGHPALELFLSKFENEVFHVFPGIPRDYNLSKEERLPMRGLAEDRNIIIK